MNKNRYLSMSNRPIQVKRGVGKYIQDSLTDMGDEVERQLNTHLYTPDGFIFSRNFRRYLNSLSPVV